MNPLRDIRRDNLLLAYQEFAQSRLIAGTSVKGLEQMFASLLGIAPSSFSQYKSRRVIGDRAASRFEAALHLPRGWMSIERPKVGLTQGEQLLVYEALVAYRRSDDEGKERLIQMVQQFK